MTEGAPRGLDALRALTDGIAAREGNARRIADLIKTLPPRDQSRIRVAAAYCPKSAKILEVFRIPPTLSPDLPLLVVPSSSAPGYGPYWAIPEQDYAVRCRCHNRRDVVLTMAMLTGAAPLPDGYTVR